MLRFHCKSAGFTALTSLVLTIPVFASDTISPGLVSHDEHPRGVFDAYATLPNSDRIVSDGDTVWREAEDGTFLQLLGTFPAPVFASFVLPDPTSTFALVGESSNGEIYRVDLGGAGFQFLCDLDYNFDARFEDAGHVLVSAATCGGLCGNEIHRIDLSTGGTTMVATVSGPSGPLARAASGDWYYGVNPDWPATTGSIVRWTAAQFSSGVLQTEATAAVVVPAGIDPASSMEFEPVFGNLFVTQPTFGGTSHVREYTPNGVLRGTIVASPDYLSGVAFFATPGIGSFQAFQPSGVRLQYRGTDYGANTSAIRSIRTKRPRASTSGPGLMGPGIVTIKVKDAMPNASVSLLMGATAHYDPNESSYDRGYFLFHTGMPITGIRALGTVATDSNGDGTFQWVNPGNLEGTRVFQTLIRDATGRFIGSSTAAFN